MKKLILSCGLAIAAMTVMAQETVKAINTPSGNTEKVETTKPAEEVLVIKEDVYDFGKIPQGKPVHHVFTVTNAGKEPLKIANVQASCGCTTPEWDKDSAIPPGEETEIKVGYNAAAEGAFTKFITVTYNDTMSKQITIKGEVWKTPAASAPENKSLNDLKNK